MSSSPRATVIVPVFNALSVVRPCVEAILRWTDLDRHRLVIADDASDEHTVAQLGLWADAEPGITVLEGDRNVGFGRNCNRAMREVDADYVVLLNSDTCVTPRWLDKMVACMESDASIGVASPISNVAPHLRVEMLPGRDYLQMAALVEHVSRRSYPDVTTPEGFCYMISRRCQEEIGYLDEIFDDGYGEESDYAMRANYYGFRTVCVDDTYIYHRGRASFGVERRNELYEQNKRIFNSRWQHRYPKDFEEFQSRDPLGYIRDALAGHREPGALPAIER